MSLISISRSIGKAFFWALFTLVLLIVLALLAFRFYPQSYLYLVNKLTPYTISAGKVEARLLPAALTFKNIELGHANTNKRPTVLVSGSDLKVSVDWPGLISGNHNYWHGEISGANINAHALSELSLGREANDDLSNSAPVNLHAMLSLLNLNIVNTEVQLSQDTRLHITKLITQYGINAKGDNKNLDEIEQNIELNLIYGEGQKKLPVSGEITSVLINGESNITIKLGGLNLDDLLMDDERSNHSATAPLQTNGTPHIDFSWLQELDPFKLKLHIDSVKFNDYSLTALLLDSRIDNGIDINSLSADGQFKLDGNLWFTDRFSLAGQLTPRKGGLVETDLSLTLSNGHLKAKGGLDLLTPPNSKLSIELDAKTFPLVDGNDKRSSLIRDNAQWLPIVSKIELVPSDNSNGNELNFRVLKLKAGLSDVQGNVSISGLSNDSQRSNRLAIKTTLTSKELIVTSTSNDQETVALDSTLANKETDVAKPSNTQTVFNSEPIVWSELFGFDLDALLSVNSLQLDDRYFQNVELPVSVNEQGLQIDGLNLNIGDGALHASFGLSLLPNQPAHLSLMAEASGISLDKLRLIDEQIMKGGNSQLKLSLKAKGNSTHDLASKLNGSVLFHVKDAVIGNDAFELVGSDLIAELISKLNPFLKSDPTTDLECAVVNLDINEGLIVVDKSIAMETSKMVVVADGSINLTDERIKLKITPQSTDGIGLDAGSLVKFLALGGTLANPKPTVGAGGLVKSGVAVGAALSTGGASLLVDGLVSKLASGKACKRALSR